MIYKGDVTETSNLPKGPTNPTPQDLKSLWPTLPTRVQREIHWSSSHTELLFALLAFPLHHIVLKHGHCKIRIGNTQLATSPSFQIGWH